MTSVSPPLEPAQQGELRDPMVPGSQSGCGGRGEEGAGSHGDRSPSTLPARQRHQAGRRAEPRQCQRRRSPGPGPELRPPEQASAHDQGCSKSFPKRGTGSTPGSGQRPEKRRAGKGWVRRSHPRPHSRRTHLLSLLRLSAGCWYCPFILLSLLQQTEQNATPTD